MGLYYHGTTKSGLHDIMNGKGKGEGPWKCSLYDEYTYLYSLDAILEEQYSDDDAIRMAFESAQIQSIFVSDVDLFVLELEIPDELVEDDISVGGRADTMSLARRIPCAQLDPSFIRQIFTTRISCWHKPFLLANVMKNELFYTDGLHDLDDGLKELAEAINNSDYPRLYDVLENLSSIDWTPYHSPHLAPIDA